MGAGMAGGGEVKGVGGRWVREKRGGGAWKQSGVGVGGVGGWVA